MATLQSSRKELRAQNGGSHAVSGKLDSSLKKNLGFIKKIRTMCSSPAINESILSDIRTLSLEKYLSELIPAFYDRLVTLCKHDDLSAAVVIFSCLFQRFGADFSGPVLSLLVNGIFSDTSTVPERSTSVALVFELNLVGIASLFSDCSQAHLSEAASRVVGKFADHNVTILSLRTIMGPSGRGGLPIMGYFARRFEKELQIGKSEPDGLNGQLSTLIQQLLERYCSQMVEEYEGLCVQERKLRRQAEAAAIRLGRDVENDELVQLAADLAPYRQHLEPMCSLLGVEFPKEETPETKAPDVGFVWWSTPAERAFYESVPELEDILENGAENGPNRESPGAKYENLSEGEKVQVFLDTLGRMTRESHLAPATVALHQYIPDNKATRQRLLRFFVDGAKTDAFGLFAKFIRINSHYFDSILLDLIAEIDRGFRSQIHTGKINYRNVVFFSELVKFHLVPAHLIFHKLRSMTVNLFSSNNIEILIIFYERLGKFLLYDAEYRETTQKMLDLLREKSRLGRLSHYEKLYLNNLFLSIDSFTGNAPVTQQTTVACSDTQDFFRQLFSHVLSSTTYPQVAKIMEQIDFSKSASTVSAFLEVFRAPDRLRSDQYLLAARTMLHISEKSRFVVVAVVQALTQQLVTGLDENDYRKNVARMSVVRFLAAMCNVGVIPFQSISDVLFKIVCHGYLNNFPTPDQNISGDPHDNYFRVQLCCTLLKDVDFERAKDQNLLFSDIKSLESFLCFLQYFCYCKKRPFPRDIEFSLSDVLTKACALGLVVNWPEDLSAAIKRFQDLIQGNNKSDRGIADEVCNDDKIGDQDDGDDEMDESEDDDTDLENLCQSSLKLNETDSDNSGIDFDTDSEIDESSDSESGSSDSEYSEHRSNSDSERHEFDREAHRFAEKQFDESMMRIMKEASTPRGQTALKMPDPSAQGVQNPQGNQPRFRFLSRSSQSKNLDLPSESRFVSSFSDKQAQKKVNKEKISNLIINMYHDT